MFIANQISADFSANGIWGWFIRKGDEKINKTCTKADSLVTINNETITWDEDITLHKKTSMKMVSQICPGKPKINLTRMCALDLNANAEWTAVDKTMCEKALDNTLIDSKPEELWEVPEEGSGRQINRIVYDLIRCNDFQTLFHFCVKNLLIFFSWWLKIFI